MTVPAPLPKARSWPLRGLQGAGLALIGFFLIGPYVFVCTMLWVISFAEAFGGHEHNQAVSMYFAGFLIALGPIALLVVAWRRRRLPNPSSLPRRRMRWWVAGALIAGFSVPFGAMLTLGAVQAQFPRELQRAAERIVSGEVLGPLDLTQLAPFEWEAVHIFTPYTPREQIEKCLGFAWGGAPDFVDERAQLFVFTARDRVISSKRMNRMVELHEVVEQGRPQRCRFPRELARFDVVRAPYEAGGNLRLVPQPSP